MISWKVFRFCSVHLRLHQAKTVGHKEKKKKKKKSTHKKWLLCSHLNNNFNNEKLLLFVHSCRFVRCRYLHFIHTVLDIDAIHIFRPWHFVRFDGVWMSVQTHSRDDVRYTHTQYVARHRILFTFSYANNVAESKYNSMSEWRAMTTSTYDDIVSTRWRYNGK